jgi:hypothetical protein
VNVIGWATAYAAGVVLGAAVAWWAERNLAWAARVAMLWPLVVVLVALLLADVLGGRLRS